MNAFDVVREFERQLALYTGAPFVVSCTSCTAALLLTIAYQFRNINLRDRPWIGRPIVKIPKLTYVGVGCSIVHAGGRPVFRDESWLGEYALKPLPVLDCARWLRAGMYQAGHFMCLSFHPAKHLGISTHGGAILTDDQEADAWLRKMRFDGRTEGIASREDSFTAVGYHCYMAPPTAAEGLERLSRLPRDNKPIPCDDYADLSKLEIFNGR